MEENAILTRCGYRCDQCLAYAPNVAREDRRQELSDGWQALFGFRIEPEQIVCEGCVSSADPVLIDKNCPVRPCAAGRKIDNCALCGEFICEKLESRIVRREEIEKRLSRVVTDTEYELFVKPYDSEPRLRAIRDTL